jgi:hypothetical protein
MTTTKTNNDAARDAWRTADYAREALALFEAMTPKERAFCVKQISIGWREEEGRVTRVTRRK